MVDSSLPLKDALARQQATDPTLSCIVQAPAGSGKTELLTQRYLRLLATVERPEQILAITFTRKAAIEMRNRILKYLHHGRGERPSTPYEANNWDLAQAALQADQQRGWHIEQQPARLRIQTIDAFNASLSRRLPMLSFMGSSMDVAQDPDPIYEAACKKLLGQLGDHSEASKHIRTLLVHLANRTQNWLTMLCDLLKRRDQWLTLVMQHHHDVDALRDSIEQTLQAVVTRHLQELRAALPASMHAELAELVSLAATNLLESDEIKIDERLLQACQSLQHLPSVDHTGLMAWQGIAKLLLTADGNFLQRITKTQGFPTDQKQAKQRMSELLTEMKSIPQLNDQFFALKNLSVGITDQQWQVLKALIRLLPHAVSTLMLEFAEHGQVDYVEVSQRALRALGTEDEPTDLAVVLDEKIKHILIDEFQDTSLAQMDLLKRLTTDWYEGDGRTVFCVGDPMQSIYRFRQAEVGLFIQMQQKGLANVRIQPLKLQTNFRSTHSIVEWVNTAFQLIMPKKDDAEMGAVSYTQSVAAPQARVDGGITVHAGIGRTASEEARQISALIKQALSADPTQRIAILVSSRKHADPIAQALKRLNIAFNAVDIEQLQDRSLVQDLMSLTRALVHLADRTAWLSCLRAPWCGLSLHDLYALAGDDSKKTIYELANALLQSNIDVDSQANNSMSHEGIQRLQAFMAVMNDSLKQRARHSLREWVERTWLALNGPSCLSEVNELDNAQAYFQRLDELDMAGDLEDIAQLPIQLDKLYAQVKTEGHARVEIMTIHKSKGLEFDVVILPSLHSKHPEDKKPLLKWTRITGLPADGLVMTPPAAKGDEKDRIYTWLDDLEKDRTLYERQRLLYVAATRAKRELHLFGSVKLNKEGEKPLQPTKGSLLSMLWPVCERQFSEAMKGIQIAAQDREEAVQQTLQRLPLGWRASACASTVKGNPFDQSVSVDQIEFDWAGEMSRHVGIVVHAELERLNRVPLNEIRQWQGTHHRTRLLLQLAEQGVPKRLQNEACERVMEAIASMLDDVRGRWILGLDTAHQDVLSEYAISGELNGKIHHCVIDRTFVDAQGTRWIIDFKTSRHEGGGLDEFLDREVERYRPQLVRYAQLMQLLNPDQPINTALYFPLMQAWRVVS